ncbi:MAG: DUF1674 domain-containing protein [Rickettsiales bacterium]
MENKEKVPEETVEVKDDNHKDEKKVGVNKEGNKPSVEIGGRGGADPTRFGDWEIAGKCVDF